MKAAQSTPEPSATVPVPVSPLVEEHTALAGVPNSPKGVEQEHGGIEIADAIRITVAAVVAVLRFWSFPQYFYLALGAVVFCGYPIYREALEAIRERKMTMELSMTIALMAALAIREVFTALMIVLFVLIAEILEGLTVGRGRSAIRSLLNLLPQTVMVRSENGEESVPLATLRPGTIAIVKPGGRIPVDGPVVAGHSFVDESSMTGESIPVEKQTGSPVYAGTMNQSGSLEIQIQAVGPDTAFGQIVQAVERAQQSRAPIQKIADRLSGYLVYFALGAALFTFLLTHNARSTISVIIVAGACGVAAGTPLAILGGIGRAAQVGVIVKGGRFLESLAETTTVVLDKTGTLTTGKPKVKTILCAPGIEPSDVLATAASAESRSEHAIAVAILEEARQRQITVRAPDTFESLPGRGVMVMDAGDQIYVGNEKLLADNNIEVGPGTLALSTSVYVARNRCWMGTIQISDALRPEAVEAVQKLKQLRIRTVLLTGDTRRATAEPAQTAGLAEIYTDLLPLQKRDKVQELKSRGEFVTMIGDGINDAPALMEATVGVAMGSGTDIARESADVLLLGNDLNRFIMTLQIARRCRRIIFTNFAGTLMVDAVGIILAALGYLNPLLAVSIHVVSELAFILNSARLLPSRGALTQESSASC